jgi:hypothetical protein
MSVGFWVPIRYDAHSRTWGQRVKENADFYFYIKSINPDVGTVTRGEYHPEKVPNGFKAITLEKKGIEIPVWKTALKVASYFTIIIPIVMLSVKLLSRWNPSFCIETLNTSEGETWLVNPPLVLQRSETLFNVTDTGELMELKYDDDNKYYSFSQRDASEMLYQIALNSYQVEDPNNPGNTLDLLDLVLKKNPAQIKNFVAYLTGTLGVMNKIPCLFFLRREKMMIVFQAATKERITINCNERYANLLQHGLVQVCITTSDKEFARALLPHLQGCENLSPLQGLADSLPRLHVQWDFVMKLPVFQNLVWDCPAKWQMLINVR